LPFTDIPIDQVAQGKTPYSIGKDLATWVEKLLETSIPPRTPEQKARRIEDATNVASPTTTCNPLEIQDNQVIEHGGARDDAGRKSKYDKPKEISKPTYSSGKNYSPKPLLPGNHAQDMHRQ